MNANVKSIEGIFNISSKIKPICQEFLSEQKQIVHTTDRRSKWEVKKISKLMCINKELLEEKDHLLKKYTDIHGIWEVKQIEVENKILSSDNDI